MTQTRGIRENGPGRRTLPIMNKPPMMPEGSLRGGCDPRETPAAMRDRPAAVSDLVLLVVGARIGARIAFERPVLGHGRGVADDPETDDRPLEPADNGRRGDLRRRDVCIERRRSLRSSRPA